MKVLKYLINQRMVKHVYFRCKIEIHHQTPTKQMSETPQLHIKNENFHLIKHGFSIRNISIFKNTYKKSVFF